MPPSPSSALTNTLPLPLLVAARLHAQVPSPWSVTVPDPLFLVIVSGSDVTSVKDPLVLSVSPSLPDWFDGAEPTAGATLMAETVNESMGLVTPFLSVAWTSTV